ncbi:MAG TPA: phage tail tube protein [Vicinamibacterales bacterium]
MSDARSAQNTYFSTGDGASPEQFGELSEVVSIGGPNETADEIDVTHLRSQGGYREFIQSFKDGGELPLNLNFIPGDTSQQAMDADFASGTTKNRRITYPDGSYDSFAGWVKARGNSEIAVGSKLARTYTVRIVGPVVLTPAA